VTRPPCPSLEHNDLSSARSIPRVLQRPFAFWPAELLLREAVEGRAARKRFAVVASRSLIGTILSNRGGLFPRAKVQDRVLGAAYGQNLVRAEQVDWRAQRRLISRPISSARAVELMPCAAEACDRLISEWSAAGRHAPDLSHDLRLLGLTAMWESLVSRGPAMAHEERELRAAARRFADLKAHPLVEELAILQTLAQIAHASEFGAGLDPNTTTLFLHAGHDNVVAALRWALWLVADRPDLQDEIAREAAGASGFDDPLPVTEAVILETLRLYPPIPQIVREVETDVEADGRVLEAGFTAILSIYALHRNRLYWDQPDDFFPERFVGDGAAQLQHVLLPYGAGARGCIGASLARLELKLFLGRIVQAFAMERAESEPPQFSTDWVIRMTSKAPVVCTLRN
jgi:cytochrome P450